MSPTVRHANYGLELVDSLTGGALRGASSVSAEWVSTPPAGVLTNLNPFLVNQSRWVFEDLEVDVALTIESDFYLTELKTTGTDLPAVPASGPGFLAQISMVPRVGYPFEPSLMRILGAAVIASTGEPAPGADVSVTPIYNATPGTAIPTKTDDEGQYVVWFLPDVSLLPADPSLPTSCDVSITLGALGGSATGVAIAAGQATGIAQISLS